MTVARGSYLVAGLIGLLLLSLVWSGDSSAGTIPWQVSTRHTNSRLTGNIRLSGTIPVHERVGRRVDLHIHFQTTGEWWPNNPLLSLQGLGAWQVLNRSPYEPPPASGHHYQAVVAGYCKPPTDDVPALLYEVRTHQPFITIPPGDCTLLLALKPRVSGVHTLSIRLHMHNVAESDGRRLDEYKLLHVRPQDKRGPIPGIELRWHIHAAKSHQGG